MMGGRDSSTFCFAALNFDRINSINRIFDREGYESSKTMKWRYIFGAFCVLAAAAVIAIPKFIASKNLKDPYAGNSCISRLNIIEGAKQQWALEHHKNSNDVPTWEDIRFYLREIPNCPAGGAYTLGSVGQAPTCSYPGHQRLR